VIAVFFAATSRALMGLFLLATAPVPASRETAIMTDESARALTLHVQARDGMVEVRLTGLAPRAQTVRYEIEVQGRSTSRHRGATTLAADTPAVLSTLRTAADEYWCVTLVAEEEGRGRYEVTHGSCAAE